MRYMYSFMSHVINLYDEYLYKTENRGISWGELAYIQNLTEEELKDLEEELNDTTTSN